MQFGFMKGKGTTDTIFIVRRMQEKFRAKGKKLYFGFVDLEKAFDRVENRGMRVNMNKTKFMISGEQQKIMQKAVRWPCSVCGTGVGNNSIQCTS